MSKYLTAGTMTSVCAVLAMLAASFGQHGLEHFFADPSTAQAILAAVGSCLALVAGGMKGVNHPEA